MTNEFDIRELVYFPIDYASDGLAESLRKRGKMFWKCRRRNYVQYIGALDDGMQKSAGPAFYRIAKVIANLDIDGFKVHD